MRHAGCLGRVDDGVFQQRLDLHSSLLSTENQEWPGEWAGEVLAPVFLAAFLTTLLVCSVLVRCAGALFNERQISRSPGSLYYALSILLASLPAHRWCVLLWMETRKEKDRKLAWLSWVRFAPRPLDIPGAPSGWAADTNRPHQPLVPRCISCENQ